MTMTGCLASLGLVDRPHKIGWDKQSVHPFAVTCLKEEIHVTKNSILG